MFFAEKDLKDEYTPLGPSCRPSSTTVNGQTSCTDRLILSDNFAGPSVDTKKWIIEHMIPTYEPPVISVLSFITEENVDFHLIFRITNLILMRMTTAQDSSKMAFYIWNRILFLIEYERL